MIIGLSMKEREQLVTFYKLKSGEISQVAAAKMLGFSVRWTRIKFKRFLKKGASGLVHRSRGRPSPKLWNQKEKEFAMSLFQQDFEGFGPTFAAEKLQELYGIKVSREVLRKAMTEYGYWKTKSRKPKYRTRRERKEFFGEMVQLDGSPHDWFESRRDKYTLLVFIDDATSTIPLMKLVPSESTESVMLALQSYVGKYGRPLSLYVDFGSVFSVNVNNDEKDKTTQFKRACNELGIDLIYAHSPQAKGRVERSNRTHQDRLVKELRLAGISTDNEANAFIENVYLPKHNSRYERPARKIGNMHRSINGYSLDEIFCIKDERIVQNDFVIQYKNRILQLTSEQRAVVRPKEYVTVKEQFDGNLKLEIRGFDLNFVELEGRPKKIAKQKTIVNKHHKPSSNHPWRLDYKGIRPHQMKVPL